MTRAQRVVTTLGACVLAAGCSGGGKVGYSGEVFRSRLDTTPKACGLDGAVLPGAQAVSRARSPEEQLHRTALLVQRIRKLRFEREVEPTFLYHAELRTRLERLTLEEITKREALIGSRALSLLGAVPRGLDLRRAVSQGVAEATAGFYDTERKRLYVGRTSRKLDEFEVETLAHELEHAVVDQMLGIPDGLEADGWGDSSLAASALTEGSALITEFRFVVARDGVDVLEPLLDSPVEEAFVSSGLPHYLEQQLLFPYLEGIGFVCTLYARGGWQAVDRAYARPPRTTAEVLFPQRYLQGERPPPGPRPSGTLARPWVRERELSGVFGAADLLALFRAPGGETSSGLDHPVGRVSAWGGGRIDVWTRRSEAALGIALVQHRSRDDLCDSVLTWYDRAFPEAARAGDRPVAFAGPRQHASISCGEREVRIGIARDARTARSLLRAAET